MECPECNLKPVKIPGGLACPGCGRRLQGKPRQDYKLLYLKVILAEYDALLTRKDELEQILDEMEKEGKE